jgi:hypothetical protein
MTTKREQVAAQQVYVRVNTRVLLDAAHAIESLIQQLESATGKPFLNNDDAYRACGGTTPAQDIAHLRGCAESDPLSAVAEVQWLREWPLEPLRITQRNMGEYERAWNEAVTAAGERLEAIASGEIGAHDIPVSAPVGSPS